MPSADRPVLAHRLGPRELADRLAAREVSVIGMREPMEYASGPIAGSLNVPLAALTQAVLPVRRPQGAPLPRMQQVQIAAGWLVLLGLLLSTFLAPARILLPKIVGAGLTFAHITGSCGLARLRALMP